MLEEFDLIEIAVVDDEKECLETLGKTAKDSDLFHGFGIENMKAICEKHNGDLKISEHDGLFDLSIFLPNIQEI